MKKAILLYFKHLFLSLLVFFIVGVSIIYYLNGAIHYGDVAGKYHWDREGPYIYYEGDSMVQVQYISGDKKTGYQVESAFLGLKDSSLVDCSFNLDSSHFSFNIEPTIVSPPSIYHDDEPILVISDVESAYATFRDFLLAQGVIDSDLNWTFGKGHLVLLGDFVDRGNSTTQVLWFIYMLEQKAKTHGGCVHFILGNHEIKNLQGNYFKASVKYFYAAAMLEKQQFDLYGSNSVLGRWLASKNTIEIINDQLFVHGGISPEILNYSADVEEINHIVQAAYRQPYYSKGYTDKEQILLSTTKGPSWYRGYFNDAISEVELDQILDTFGVDAIVVGHTIQKRVRKMYQGRIFAIDVNHPKDYRKSWPFYSSEGMLIQDGQYFRLFHDGRKKLL